MLLPFDLSRAEDYRIFLNIHLGALSSLQPDWRLEDGADFAQMLGCVQADLMILGGMANVPPLLTSTPASPSTGLGIAYVVRGSRLGATVLRRGVGAHFPTSYLDFAPALSWAAFLLELESIADDPAGRQEATRGACGTFNKFASEFNRLQRATPTPPR